MREVGYVTHVTPEPDGDELASDVIAGVTVLPLKDVADFFLPHAESTLTIGSETHVYTTVNEDTDEVTLATPLANAYSADEKVTLGGHEVKAGVRVGPDVAESYTCVVPSAMIDRLGGNVYDLLRKVVALKDDDGGLPEVDTILGELPEIDGSFIDPVTIPTPPLTDGDPPASSPTATVTAGILSLIVTWDATINADAVLYDIHIDDTSGFATGPTTLLEEDYAGTLKVITSLPDGSQLDPDTVYYVRVVAKDADGSAAAGVEDSGQPLRIIGTTHITDESIDTPQLRANSVTVDKAVVNELVAAGLAVEQLIAGVLKTAESGRRMEMGSLGLFGFESDESSLLSIPTDGSASILNMDVIAKSLLALNGAILRNVSRITKGGALELESATETPMVSPVVQTAWPSVTLGNTDFPSAKRGLYWDAATTSWYFCHAIDNSSVVNIDADGSALGATSLVTNFASFSAQGGITKIGSTWYVLGVNTDTGNWYVSRHDASFNVLGNWQYTDESAGFRPAIGTDGTNILIARVAPNDGSVVKVRSYNPTTGAAVGTPVTTGTFGNVDVTSISFGSFDFGADRYLIGISPVSVTGGFGHAVKVYNSAGVNQPNEEWLPAGAARATGLAWDGTQFWSIDQSTSKLSRYTANKWTSESSKWWVAYSMRDGDATGGEHETPLSPKQSFTMYKRAALQWTTPAIPDSGGTDDPDRVRLWIGRGAAEPTDSAMWLNASPSPGVVTGSVEAAVFSGTHFTGGKAADFPDTTPAEIRTVDGIPLFRANGFPRVRLTRFTTQSANDASDKVFDWVNEEVDTDAFWSAGLPARIILPFAGQWLVAYQLRWASNINNNRQAWVEASDTGGSSWFVKDATVDRRPAVGGFESTNSCTATITSNVGTILRLVGRQNSGGALNIAGGAISVMYIGPA